MMKMFVPESSKSKSKSKMKIKKESLFLKKCAKAV